MVECNSCVGLVHTCADLPCTYNIKLKMSHPNNGSVALGGDGQLWPVGKGNIAWSHALAHCRFATSTRRVAGGQPPLTWPQHCPLAQTGA